MAVMNRPRSSGPDPSSTVENPSEPQWENKALGRGAKTKVKAGFGREPDQILFESDANDQTITHRREGEANSTTKRTRG